MKKIKTKAELDEILEANGVSVTVLKFSADWCSPCRALANTINSLTAEESSGVEFVEVDVDEADEGFIEEYGIRNIPVMIFFKDGLIANKTVGLRTKQDLLTIIDEVKSK